MMRANMLRASGYASVPYIYSTSAVDTNTLSFPAATAGDVAILVCSVGGDELLAWNLLETGTIGCVLTKTMAGGETSITTVSTNKHLQISFWRGYSEPPGTNSADLVTAGGPPNPPTATVQEVFATDIVLIAGFCDHTGFTYTSEMPSGYTTIEFSEAGSGSAVMATGYATGLTGGAINPDVFPWTPTSGSSYAATIVLNAV